MANGQKSSESQVRTLWRLSKLSYPFLYQKLFNKFRCVCKCLIVVHYPVIFAKKFGIPRYSVISLTVKQYIFRRLSCHGPNRCSHSTDQKVLLGNRITKDTRNIYGLVAHQFYIPKRYSFGFIFELGLTHC